MNDSVYKVLVNGICTFEESSFPKENKGFCDIPVRHEENNDSVQVQCVPFYHEHPCPVHVRELGQMRIPSPFVPFYLHQEL